MGLERHGGMRILERGEFFALVLKDPVLLCLFDVSLLGSLSNNQMMVKQVLLVSPPSGCMLSQDLSGRVPLIPSQRCWLDIGQPSSLLDKESQVCNSWRYSSIRWAWPFADVQSLLFSGYRRGFICSHQSNIPASTWWCKTCMNILVRTGASGCYWDWFLLKYQSGLLLVFFFE